MKVLTDEEKDLKLIAKRAIDKAEKETGCKDVKNDNPRLYKTFQQFPDDQAMLDDRIHETRAKAEMCMGTDQSVGVAALLCVGAMSNSITVLDCGRVQR